MNLVAELLFLAAALALAAAAVLAAARLPFFPLRELDVVSPLREVTAMQIEYAAGSALSGNFFTVRLEGVRAAFEKLSWVRRAEVRRRWPDALELRIEEHVAEARWQQADGGESRLVNRQGEVFAAASDAGLPLFSGPEGSAAQVLARYREFVPLLASLGRQPQSLSLSPRQAWQLKLDDGLVLDLGREQSAAQAGERLQRFVDAYPQAARRLGGRAEVIDLRYPNGFALRLARSGERQQ